MKRTGRRRIKIHFSFFFLEFVDIFYVGIQLQRNSGRSIPQLIVVKLVIPQYKLLISSLIKIHVSNFVTAISDTLLLDYKQGESKASPSLRISIGS